MKAQDKPEYVTQARKLLGSLDLESLVSNPNNLADISKINRLIAIFTSFSFNDGQELRRLFQEFQKWGRRSTHTGIIRNKAVDVLQFIDQKIEEIDLYVIEDSSKSSRDRIVKKSKKNINPRDNFGESKSKTIAERAAYICSNPECRMTTTRPHTDVNKSLKNGVAAHICAASSGGPRYDPKQTPEERSSVSNGIWLCHNCSDLVDKDPSMYTKEILINWKELHADFVTNGTNRPSGGIGIHDSGKGTKMYNNTIIGYETGIKEEGENAEAMGNKIIK